MPHFSLVCPACDHATVWRSRTGWGRQPARLVGLYPVWCGLCRYRFWAFSVVPPPYPPRRPAEPSVVAARMSSPSVETLSDAHPLPGRIPADETAPDHAPLRPVPPVEPAPEPRGSGVRTPERKSR